MTTEYLLNEQMEHVLAALTPANRLVMRVCLHTGLRVGDVLAFRTEQLGTPQFWITEQKTGKRRRVNLTTELWNELRADRPAQEETPTTEQRLTTLEEAMEMILTGVTEP